MSAEREQQPGAAPVLPHQRRSSGNTLTVTGRTLRFLGYALATGCGSLLLKHFVIAPGPQVGHIPWPLRLLIVLGILEGGWLVFRASRRVVVRGRRHRTRIITAFEELRGVRYILYLRPFALDTQMSLPPPEAPGWWMRSPFELPGLTMEDFLVRQFTRHGRVVAVGEPGEDARPPASKREWQSPLRAFVTFAEGWQPSLHWFVVTVPRIRHVWTMRRLVRERIDAMVGAWAALPQRQASSGTVPPPAPVVTSPATRPRPATAAAPAGQHTGRAERQTTRPQNATT